MAIVKTNARANVVEKCLCGQSSAEGVHHHHQSEDEGRDDDCETARGAIDVQRNAGIRKNSRRLQNEDQGGQTQAELAGADPRPIDELEQILDDGSEDARTLGGRSRGHAPASTPPSASLANGAS